MNMTVSIPFTFRASHHLSVRPEAHEHTYRLVLTVAGRPDPDTGFVCDMYRIREIAAPLVAALDGALLNGHEALAQVEILGLNAARTPTCEALAAYFYDRLRVGVAEAGAGARLHRVTVSLADGGDAGEEGWAELVV